MRKYKGFTLVELVVVVMILGILAAVAAPRLLGTTAAANENAARQSLAVIRDAIERYMAEGGQLPTADIVTELTPLLRSFPRCPVGGKDAPAGVATTGSAPDGDEGWRYDPGTGDFTINSTATDSDGVAYNTY